MWIEGLPSIGFLASGRVAMSLLSFLQGPVELLRRAWDYLDHDFKIGKLSVSVTSLVEGIAVLLLAIFISRSLRSVLQHRMAKGMYIDRSIQYTITRLIHYAVITVGTLYAMKVGVGADLTSLAVVFTALSVGIGFGLQYIAHDIASGFILLFERPVRIGDRVTIDNEEGDVRSINLRTTVILTNDRLSVIVPNSKLVSQRVINWSYPDTRARISVPVGVSYDSDVDVVTKTLLRAVEGVDKVLEQPEPKVQFLKFGDSSLDFRLMVWTNEPRSHPQIKSDINYRIDKLFREAKIEIPYPQQEIRMRPSSLNLDNGNDNLLAQERRADEKATR
jgi:potassium-dependent mechanosensitive channel